MLDCHSVEFFLVEFLVSFLITVFSLWWFRCDFVLLQDVFVVIVACGCFFDFFLCFFLVVVSCALMVFILCFFTFVVMFILGVFMGL